MAPAPLRDDPWLLAALTLASATLAWPLLSHDYLPLLDLPQHVGAVAILAGGPESLGFARYYSLDLLGSPYLLPYLLAALLAKVVGAKAAVHGLFALAAAAWPWATAAALTGLGRDRRAALLLAPLAYGTFVFLGFLNFALSLPLYLLWLGHFCAHLDDATTTSQPSQRRRTWMAGALLGVLLYYGHVMTFAFAIGSAALAVLLMPLPTRVRSQDQPSEAVGAALDSSHAGWTWIDALRRGKALLQLAPGGLLLIGWLLGSETAGKGELGRMIGGAMAHEPPRWDAPLDRIKVLLDHLLACYHDADDEWLLYALLTVLAAAALLRMSRPSVLADDAPGHVAPSSAPRTLPLALLLAAVVCGLLLPAAYRGIWPIAGRMAPFVLMLLVLLPRGRLLGGRLWLAVGLGLCIATAVVHDRHFERFDAEVGPFDEVLAALPDGPRVMTLVFDNGSHIVTWPAFLHFSQYAIAAHGGVAEFSFVNFTKSPIHYRDADAPPQLPARFEWTPERYDHAGDGAYYSHLLVRGAQARVDLLLRRGGPAMRISKQAGRWTLYERAD